MVSRPHLHVLNHPVIRSALTVMRDTSSTLSQFREACAQVVPAVLFEASKDFEVATTKTTTPLTETTGYKLKNDVALIPILRAGMAMVETSLKFLPGARVGYFGLQRDEATAKASSYYQKLPNIEGSHVILLDPMLATGGSADFAISEILKLKPKSLSFACIVAAPEGVDLLNKKWPRVEIYTAALDDHLDERKYIVPGLGDFGDRYHGTAGW
jgi:uracil phosphoribosyltransferase